jgi:hypothetical protein
MVVACRDEPAAVLRLQADGEDRVEAAELSASPGCVVSFAGLAEVGERVDTLGEVIDMIRDGSCPPVDDDHRLCRSLFLIGATDPLVGVGLGLERSQVERLVEWHRWALADGIDAARSNVAVAEALRAIDQLDVAGVLLGDDPSALAEVAIARASLAIIEPLAAAEQACLSLPR